MMKFVENRSGALTIMCNLTTGIIVVLGILPSAVIALHEASMTGVEGMALLFYTVIAALTPVGCVMLDRHRKNSGKRRLMPAFCIGFPLTILSAAHVHAPQYFTRANLVFDCIIFTSAVYCAITALRWGRSGSPSQTAQVASLAQGEQTVPTETTTEATEQGASACATTLEEATEQGASVSDTTDTTMVQTEVAAVAQAANVEPVADVALIAGATASCLPRVSPGRAAGAALLLWCGLWVFFALVLFIPPIAAMLFEGAYYLVARGVLHTLRMLPLSLAILTLGGLLGFWACCLPAGYIAAALSHGLGTLKTIAAEKSASCLAVFVLTFGLTTGMFWYFSDTSQHLEVERLRNSPHTEAFKADVAAREAHYKELLAEEFWRPRRVLFNRHETTPLQMIYASVFHARKDKTQFINEIFCFVYKPFMHEGSPEGSDHDRRLAAEAYRKLFDEPITEARAIYYNGENGASAQRRQPDGISKMQPEVRLSRQELTLKEDGEWAEVELHEVYNNPTYRSQEVTLYFTLPEGTVITGVWLSNTAEKKFAARVSPRGAAQKVYKSIVARGDDPALAEQIGPNLYRLRVFPVPRQGVMHMWLGLRALKQGNEVWQLPKLTEKRNVYWDEKTDYLQNGISLKKEEGWLPASLPILARSTPQEQTLHVNDGLMTMRPYADTAKPACDISAVIDTSYSMQPRREEIIRHVEELESLCPSSILWYSMSDKLAVISGNPVEYMKATQFWGALDMADLAVALPGLKHPSEDTIVITDKTLFRERAEPEILAKLQTPLWFLFTDGTPASLVDGGLLKSLYRTGGGADTKAAPLLTAAAKRRALRSIPSAVALDGRYLWTFSPVQAESAPASAEMAEATRPAGRNATLPATSGPMMPLATHHLIAAHMTKGRDEGNAALDGLQQLAAKGRVVTPYSSMIVLVDKWQEQQLAEAEKSADRFNVSPENKADEVSQVPTLSAFSATAVPEPEEWALIIAGSALLLVHIWRNKRRLLSRWAATRAFAPA